MRRLRHDGPRVPHAFHPERRTVCDAQRVPKQKDERRASRASHANRAERTARAACTGASVAPTEAGHRAARLATRDALASRTAHENLATRVACVACETAQSVRRAHAPRCTLRRMRRMRFHVLHTMEHRGRTRTYHESTVAYGVIGHYSAIVADFSPNGISIVVFLYLEVEVKLITIHRNSMYFNLSLQRKL